MSDHLRDATHELRARFEELGGSALINALDQLVEAEERVCAWFDRQDDDHAADEISDWFVISADKREAGALHVELGVEVCVYPTDDEPEEERGHTTLPAYVLVRQGPPLRAEHLDLDAADADLKARMAARRPTVNVQETERGLEVHGLPRPDEAASADATVPGSGPDPAPAA